MIEILNIDQYSDYDIFCMESKGYANFKIRYNNSIYDVTFYDKTRLIQDLEATKENIVIESGFILLNSLTLENIFFALGIAVKEHFFDRLVPDKP